VSYDDEHRTPSRLHGRATWLLNRAARVAKQLTWASLVDAGMRRGFYGVLATLDEFGPAAQAEIGRRVGLDPSDMVDLLNDLEGRGYVRREQDPADRRRNIVTLTKTGSRALDRFDDAISAAEDQLLASFSSSDRATLLRLLRVLADAKPDAASR
jgi:MarR family transcriptional regulator, lower aerobic nicotinate degradation pathway regulator